MRVRQPPDDAQSPTRESSAADGSSLLGRFTRDDRSLLSDDRGIEGLPVRLVIALVVGVAALGIMMGILGNIGDVGQTELEIHFEDEVIYMEDMDGSSTSSTNETVVVNVESEDGEPVQDGRLLIEAGTAQLDTPQTAEIGGYTDAYDNTVANADDEVDDNQVGFAFTDQQGDHGNGVGLRADQNQGTLDVTIIPPSDSDYVDALENNPIVVIEGEG